jgi:hypothetical protein
VEENRKLSNWLSCGRKISGNFGWYLVYHGGKDITSHRTVVNSIKNNCANMFAPSQKFMRSVNKMHLTILQCHKTAVISFFKVT